MNIEQARQIVAAYIADWTTEKLLSVIAFCEDGRMDFWNSCCCLRGVDSAKILHSTPAMECTDNDLLHHYFGSRNIEGLEVAYYTLGFNESLIERQYLRDREFLAILRAELERRPPLVIEISELDAVELEEVCA